RIEGGRMANAIVHPDARRSRPWTSVQIDGLGLTGLLAAGVRVCITSRARVRLVAATGREKRINWTAVGGACDLGGGVADRSAGCCLGCSWRLVGVGQHGQRAEPRPDDRAGTVSGQVFLRLPRASHSVALVHRMLVPVGSRIDTTHGTV